MLVEALNLASSEQEPEQITDKKARKAYREEAIKHNKLLHVFCTGSPAESAEEKTKLVVKEEDPDSEDLKQSKKPAEKALMGASSKFPPPKPPPSLAAAGESSNGSSI